MIYSSLYYPFFNNYYNRSQRQYTNKCKEKLSTVTCYCEIFESCKKFNMKPLMQYILFSQVANKGLEIKKNCVILNPLMNFISYWFFQL